MRALLIIVGLLLSFGASAQIYRWVDASGRVHYSNDTPPPGAKASTLSIDARPGPPSAPLREPLPAHHAGATVAAVDAAPAPKAVRGLDFRKYLSVQRGMSEGELLGIAGEPDLLTRNSRASKAYTYFPTPADPFTTTITLVRGRVSEIERVRKF
jgi:Domain of unknown function (DUF4124)